MRRIRQFCLSVLSVLACSAALGGSPAEAERSFYPGRYFVRWQAGSTVLDVAGADARAGARIQVWQKLAGGNQIWEIIPSPEAGYYYLRSDLGRYLDVQWGSANSGTPIHTWDFNGGAAQKWQIIDYGTRVVLRSKLGTYLRVQVPSDNNGTRLVAGSNSPSSEASWVLEPAEVVPGSYYLRSAAASRYLDVTAVNPNAGALLQVWDKVGGPNQKWELIPSEVPGFYQVKSALGRYLDVQWGAAAAGTPVHLWDFNGADAQLWRVGLEADGLVTLRSRVGTYLSLGGTSTANGTPVRMAASTASSSSHPTRWQLEPAVERPLHGWADLHTHPMSHLGFGKKVMHGAPDVGSIIPAGTRDCNPADFRASSIDQALGHCNSSHGGWGTDNTCGDYVRAVALNKGFDTEFIHQSSNLHGDHHHEGYPNLPYWPHQSSITHQQMWWEWIKRAHQGGLRAIVALAVNSELFASLINGDPPRDDRASADLQIDELRSFVARHNDFMELALSAADLRRIAAAGKLAVIVGIEVDNIGNFNVTRASESAVRSELRRLHDKGVRYFFPVHLMNNAFGGTAIYEDLFNFANKYSTGEPFNVVTSADRTITTRLSTAPFWLGPALDAASGIPYPPAFNLFTCPAGVLGCWDQFVRARNLVYPDPRMGAYAFVPPGHVNAVGLNPAGEVAMNELMRLGVLVDLDHMSERAQVRAIELAEAAAPGGYPVFFGHNGMRGSSGSERSLSPSLTARASRLGGMIGVGTANTEPRAFIGAYRSVFASAGRRAAALGSDANGMERLPRATAGLVSSDFYSEFARAQTGNRVFDYTTEGVAHYGLMWDFLRDVERQENGAAVVGSLHRSTEMLAQAWERAARTAAAITASPVLPPAARATELTLTFRNGADGARGGHEISAAVRLRDGTVLARAPRFSDGAEWPGGSTQTVTYRLAREVLVTDISAVEIYFEDGDCFLCRGDDWQIQNLRVDVSMPASSAVTLVNDVSFSFHMRGVFMAPISS